MHFTPLIQKGILIKAIKTNKMVSLAIGCRFISGQYKLNVYLISSSGKVKTFHLLKTVQEEEEYLVAASLLGENEFL